MSPDNIVIKKRGFVSGLKLKENKISAGLPIERFHIPDRVIIPLQQHIGAPCNLTVERGDFVKTGQVIAESPAFVSAKIHASISGRVNRTLRILCPPAAKIINAVEITSETDSETDKESVDSEKNTSIKDAAENPEFDLSNNENISETDRFKKMSEIVVNMSAADIINKIRDAGIVGLGGATFPTHVKLSIPDGKNIDTVIINGCECEPYITVDHRLMLDYGFEVLAGAYIIYRVLRPDRVYIAIEENKEDAILNLEKIIASLGLEKIFKIFVLPSKYPMGAEKTLIKNILKRKVPAGGLPLDVGVVVNNVGTAKAIYDAVVKNKPLIERVVTITGEDVDEPKNLMVRIGTLIDEFGKYFGEFDSKAYKIIFGGPMTGFSVVNMDFPVAKGLNCILIKEVKKKEESNCIRCSRCVNACPMNLVPLMYANFVKNNKFDLCREYYIDSCIECGACAYVCPASIPLVGYIRTGKAALAREK